MSGTNLGYLLRHPYAESGTELGYLLHRVWSVLTLAIILRQVAGNLEVHPRDRRRRDLPADRRSGWSRYRIWGVTSQGREVTSQDRKSRHRVG